MNITSTVQSPKAFHLQQQHLPAQPEGLLFGINNPSAELSTAARNTLSLDYNPSHLFIGVPLSSMPTPMDKAITKVYTNALKLFTKEVANASGNAAIKTAVDMAWVGWGTYLLCQSWTNPKQDKNIPSLIIDTSETALDVLGLLSDATNVGTDFFANEELQQNVDMVFTGLGAVTNGEDVGTAIVNSQIGGSEAGKYLPLVTPLLNAAVSTDPMYQQVTFKPLPQVSRLSQTASTEKQPMQSK